MFFRQTIDNIVFSYVCPIQSGDMKAPECSSLFFYRITKFKIYNLISTLLSLSESLDRQKHSVSRVNTTLLLRMGKSKIRNHLERRNKARHNYQNEKTRSTVYYKCWYTLSAVYRSFSYPLNIY